MKWFEDSLVLLETDARAAVADCYAHECGLLIDVDLDRLVRGPVFQRVVDQVCEDLFDTDDVDARRLRSGRRPTHRDFAPRVLAELAPDGACQRDEVRWLAVELEASGPNPADVEESLQQVAQFPGPGAHDLEVASQRVAVVVRT